jgi:hypothetical protein
MQQMECNSKTTSAGGNFGLALLALAHEHENLWMLAAGIQRHKIGEEIKHLTDRIMQEKEGHGLCDRETKTTKGTTLARAAERLNTVVKANLGTTTIHDQETGYEQILGRIETSDAGPRTETTRAARLNKKLRRENQSGVCTLASGHQNRVEERAGDVLSAPCVGDSRGRRKLQQETKSGTRRTRRR